MNKRTRSSTWLAELPVLVLGLVLFLVLTFYQIELPGPHTDEAQEILPAIQLLRGQPVECYKNACLELFGVRFPLVIYEYIATVNTYLVIPFFALLGINVPALRTMPIVLSAVAMLFLYLLARDLYGRRTAALAYLLLSVSPSFVFWTRQGVFVTSVTIPISLIAVWSLQRGWRRGTARYLYLGAFLFGLGISAKLLFWWLIAGVGAAFVLLNADRIVACLRERSMAPLGIQLRWRDLFVAGALFALGLMPLILFNIKAPLSTLHYIRDNVTASSYYDVDNTNVAENLRERIKQLRSVLNGETFWYLASVPYASWRYPSAFVIAIGVLVFSAFGSRKKTLRETLPAWITVAAVIVPGYIALRFLPLHELQWVKWLPVISLTTVVGSGLFLARGRGLIGWARHLATGISACLLYLLFIYLAWKLAAWRAPWKILLAGVGCLVLAPWMRARESVRRALFPVLVIAVMILASVKTPTALWFTHLAILTPWPILAIAAIADLVAKRLGLDRVNLAQWPALRERQWAQAFSLGLVAMFALGGVLVYDDLEVDVAYHQGLKKVGGKGDHTDASYRLVQHLQENNLTHVVAMDWGIQDLVQFLSKGEINPPEIFGYESREDVDPAFAIRVREQLEDPQAVYVFRVRPHFRNRLETFQVIVAEEGKTLVEEAVIRDLPGIPIFWLVRVVP